MMSVRAFVSGAIVAALGMGSATAQSSTGDLAGASRGVLEAGYVFNIVDWDGGDLPRVYERSEQLPLTLAGIRTLSASGFADSTITKMVEERRCACDASVDALVALKRDGVKESVIQAVSLHSLAPNRALNLTITMDFEGKGGAAAVSDQARRGYLYLIIPDGDRDRVFYGNLQSILSGRWQRDTAIDNTDLLMPKKVRRVSFTARVPLKAHGPRKAVVFASPKPDIYTVADIPAADVEGIQEFAFDYPVSSPLQDCSLQILHRQDAMLSNTWHLERSHFEGEWE